MVELIVLVLFVVGLWLSGILRDAAERLRDRRRDAAVAGALASLRGQPVEQAVARFGPPTEVAAAPTGRRLYIWKPPAARSIPEGSGLLVVSITVDPSGIVVDSTWRTRLFRLF